MFVYGGSWQTAEKAHYGFVGGALAKLGYFVAIPNYRLYPAAVFPEFVHDVAKVIGHPRVRKKDAADTIVLMGHSAGALNAAHVSYDKKRLRSGGATQVDLFISVAGPHDYFFTL